MSDRNVINGTAAVMISPIVDFYTALLPCLGVAAVIPTPPRFSKEMKRNDDE